MDRRRLLLSATAAVAIAGFDLRTRRWVTAAEAASGSIEPLPALDGVVVRDDSTLRADSRDEGNIVSRRPAAVLRPGSVQDIATMIRFCRRNGLAVAARGTAHTVFGQSLVPAGLVVELRTLDTVHEIAADRADVDAGVLWKDLFARTTAQDVTFPVFTGYTAMTVGGTLSVGGVGVTPRDGVQVEWVPRLQVVTGEGTVVWCSPTVNADLFHGVLAGVGQLGIITRAVLTLRPVPRRVTQWTLAYTDPHAFFRDLRTVLARGEFECVYGQIAVPEIALLADPSPLVRPLGQLLPVIEAVTGPLGRGLGSVVSVPGLPLLTPWIYQLNVATYHSEGAAPDARHLLRDLSDLRLLGQSQERSYLDFVYRVDVLVELFKAAGLWHDVPHPWIDVFLPGEAVEPFVVHTLSRLRFDDLGLAGFGLLFPVLRSTLTRPSLAVPASGGDWIYLFDILTSAPLPGRNAEFVTEKLARNRRLYEWARAVGGTVYPISAVAMQPADWAHQYGERYPELVALKRRHDPDGILTPGIRIC